MTPLQMQTAFQRQVDQFENAPEYNTTDIFYWLNKAVTLFVDAVLSQDLPDPEDSDVSALLTTATITSSGTGSKPNSYLFTYPADHYASIGEEVTITFTDALNVAHPIRTGITECTLDRYSRQVEDAFSEHRLRMFTARPLRLKNNINVEIITDGNYSVTNYWLKYIKDPVVITRTVSCDLSPDVHSKIVDIAVQQFLISVGLTQAKENSVSE